MAQVKPESKDQGNTFFNIPVTYNLFMYVCICIAYKLCEPKNLLEKKRVLLGHTCYDTNGSAWKASDSGTLFSSWVDRPTMFILLLI